MTPEHCSVRLPIRAMYFIYTRLRFPGSKQVGRNQYPPKEIHQMTTAGFQFEIKLFLTFVYIKRIQKERQATHFSAVLCSRAAKRPIVDSWGKH